jgi:hypothetical protein
MQTLHYLTLSLIIPPLLAAFADTTSLDYEGGAASVGMSCASVVWDTVLTSFDRHDYGLATNGWSANCNRDANR